VEGQQRRRVPPVGGRAIRLIALALVWGAAHLPRPTAYPITELAPGVYVVPGDTGRGSEGRPNAGFVVTDSGVIVIDAEGSPYQAKRLLASIRTVTAARVRWLILTHHHPDHTFGAIVFKRLGARVIAHPDRTMLAAEGGDDALLASWDGVVGLQELAGFAFADTPDLPITRDTTLVLGGREIRLLHPPNAHTVGDLAIWLGEAKVLYAGDLVVEDGVTMVVDGSSFGALSATDELAALHARVVVPGHGRIVHDPTEQIALTRAYLDSAQLAMAQAINNVTPLARVLQQMPPPDSGRPVSLASRRQRNAVRIYAEMEKLQLSPGLTTTAALASLRGHFATVLDVRTDMSLYLAGHIPGAVYLNVETLRSFAAGVPNLLLPGESYVTLFTRLGIREGRPVVVYSAGDTRNTDATYVAWILGGFGIPVSVLDGGFQKWDLEQRPVERTYPAAVSGTFPSRDFRPDRATLDDVIHRPANTVLVDARSPEQYTGQAGAQMRRGHIPGAINHYWTTDLGTGLSHVFKSADALRASYAAQGITPDSPIIAYCNGGLESSHIYFVLHTLLGYPHVRVYDGSWTEYAAHPELPITAGAQ
jgi:thiosulfate/3-mercaptopyruvate sulfurtransferase